MDRSEFPLFRALGVTARFVQNRALSQASAVCRDGRTFDGVISKLRPEAAGFTYQSVWLDSKPTWVFVFASSKGLERAEVLLRLRALMTGAMAFYNRNCFTVIDRDSEGYEVSMGLLGPATHACGTENRAGTVRSPANGHEAHPARSLDVVSRRARSG
jgi:hypothetical protein